MRFFDFASLEPNAIWLFEKDNYGFNRQHYTKVFWRELQNPDTFAKVQRMILGHAHQ